MTHEQIRLARHALGLNGWNTRSYRTHYVTGEGTDCFPELMAMVKDGHMTTTGPNPNFAGMHCFIITRKGAEASLRPGESLDPEDFPELETA